MAYHRREQSIALLVLIIHASSITTKSTKQNVNVNPVYEVINEQARIDKEIRPITGNLPYGNPLAGNSQNNARLHAQNQQAMFNAEKVRQLRAQLQRLAQMPRMDSYMQAYHDSQESYQIAQENQQVKALSPREKALSPREKNGRSRLRQNIKTELNKGVRVIPDVVKITKADAIQTDKVRSHRSHGSVDYHQYVQPKMYKTIYVSPAPTYDQGVTIKPNGNIGLSQHTEDTQLYTEAIPSTQYVYPKQYSQMQGYESAQEIATLNSLLKKNPNEQLSELNALINGNTGKKNELETPIDLYFYMKDQPADSDHYNQMLHEQHPTYASAYADMKDHTPITEEQDDVEDPRSPKQQVFATQTVVTPTPELEIETTTTKSNNYYKVEVASQTISSGPKYQYYKEQEKNKLQYIQPIKQYLKKEASSEDSQGYFHHNAQHTGIQHLSEDGTEISAYDDDNLHYAANYEFGYRVRDHHSGNDFGHHEAKNEGMTNGHYHVLLPDGRMQKVRYSAGPGGFHADITYDQH